MLVQELLDDILCTLSHNARSGLRPVVYTILEQDILDLQHKDVIDETMDAHRGKLFDRSTRANSLSKKFLKSGWFMAQTAAIVQRNTDSTIADQNSVIDKLAECEPVGGSGAHGTVIDAPQSQSDSGARNPLPQVLQKSIEKSFCET